MTIRTTIGQVAKRAAIGTCALGLAAMAPSVGLLAMSSASANAPGNPGVPSDPEVLFFEGFGTGLTSGEIARLDQYAGGKYTADPAWLNETAGNGLIVDGTTTDADISGAGYTGATSPGTNEPTRGGELRALAETIGTLNGTSPATDNHAVTAYSDADPGANAVEFEIKDPLGLHADGRFLTISANVGVENCFASAPQLKFYLLDGGVESAVNDVALNPCGGTSGSAPIATTLTGGNAVLFDGNQVGVRLRNENGSGGGNDHAYDDIRVLDVTPQLDKEFDATGREKVGDIVTLVLTVTNTSELGAKVGWEFTDALSKGLEVAGDLTTDCVADVTANLGAHVIKVKNGALALGQASCSVTVPVTATKGGTFENGPENITSTGLDKPAVAEVTFAAPKPVRPEPTLPDTGATAADHTDAWIATGGGVAMALGVATIVVGSRRKRALR